MLPNIIKKAILTKPGCFEIIETRPKKLEENEILVKVIFSGICGSDISSYLGKNRLISYPVALGHEFVGSVINIGKKIKQIKNKDLVVAEPIISCGKCIYCQSGDYNLCISLKGFDGAFSDYIVLKGNQVYKIPEESDLKEMVFVEPLAVALHAVKISKIKNHERVLIIGAGTVGQMVMQVVKHYGAEHIVISDIVQLKLDIARNNGADSVIKVDKDVSFRNILNDVDIDVVFDCTSNDSSIQNTIDAIKKKGRIISVGQASNNLYVDMIMVMWHELKIFGSCMYNNGDFLDALELISKKEVRCSDYISEVFSLDNIQYAFEKIINNRDKYIKCLIKN